MNMKLIPINDDNKAAVLGLSSRDDQPFCVPNEYSLEQAEECNAECPGVARPFAIYAEDKLVGFCMFAFDPEEEDEDEDLEDEDWEDDEDEDDEDELDW